MNELAKILIGVFSTVMTATGIVVAKLIKDLYKEKKKNKQLVELCNYTMGSVDTILEDGVKMEPELRATLRKASRKYHRLDIVKDKKEDDE